MARDGVTAKLRGAMRQAATDNETVAFNAWIRHGGTRRAVAVTVAPVSGMKAQDGLLLVSFRSEEAPQASPPARQDGDKQDRGAERALEDELKATRAELHSTAAQMESATEELKASNEEITSMNEELQSTNEELETSKEELQSFNEELHTVNNQLQHKIQELEETTDHLNNLLSGTELATVFLDSGLRIKWFSPASKDLLDLVASDIGRPVSHFTLKVADEALLRDAEIVLEKLTRIDAEVQGDAGRWYLRRLIPYRTHDNRIAGVVVTFTDITQRKQAVDAADEARIYARPSSKRCAIPCWFSTAICGSNRSTRPSLRRSDVGGRSRKGLCCTNWTTAPGTSRSCGGCSTRSCRRTMPSTASGSTTISRAGAGDTCCSTRASCHATAIAWN
jgi:two-component system, chemotaxis family, CheB/CheR fusion protein